MTTVYHVTLSRSARDDIEHVLAWLAEQGAAHAGTRWVHHLLHAIATLETHPLRCPVVQNEDGTELRQLLFGKGRSQYRILFVIHKKNVHVLHVRHAARKPL